MYKISNSIKLAHSKDRVWSLISLPENLNLFHPFCKKNNLLQSDGEKIIKDELIYLNGRTYHRFFYKWDPMNGYQIKIGTKEGKKSDVIWKISALEKFTKLTITVTPYLSSKTPKFFYPLFHYFFIKPKLKSYLGSVLKGIKFHLNTEQKVKANQFGTHPWFS
tara:strand:- start:3003 stop:3491 length:489 start_codon:yes stop_codon:yes gene_type:complete